MWPFIPEMPPTDSHSKSALLMSEVAHGDLGTGSGKSWRSLNLFFPVSHQSELSCFNMWISFVTFKDTKHFKDIIKHFKDREKMQRITL